MNKNFINFKKAVIEGIVTVVGDRQIKFSETYEEYGLSDKAATRLEKAIGLNSRYVLSGNQTTADMCYQASKNLLNGTDTDPSTIDGLIFVSQTPDYASPATAIYLQNKLGLKSTSICFDIRLGCSGFVYGLSVAYAFIESGVGSILLCVGDAASKIVDNSNHTVAPLMGDAGSAILVTSGLSDSYFNLNSDGSGMHSLIIPNSGIRADERYSNISPKLIMDGPAVFDFTLKRVPDMIYKTLEFANHDLNSIDYFVMHQPNKYILDTIKSKIGVSKDKMPTETQTLYGNQNSASIPGTINGYLSNSYNIKRLKSMFVGFGVGLSWASCIVETDKIYTPNVIHYDKEVL